MDMHGLKEMFLKLPSIGSDTTYTPSNAYRSLLFCWWANSSKRLINMALKKADAVLKLFSTPTDYIPSSFKELYALESCSYAIVFLMEPKMNLFLFLFWRAVARSRELNCWNKLISLLKLMLNLFDLFIAMIALLFNETMRNINFWKTRLY